MPLPHFHPIQKVELNPISENLFKIKIDNILLGDPIKYKLNTVKKKLHLHFYINEDDLKDMFYLGINEVEISHHDKNGIILFKYDIGNIKQLGYIAKAKYEDPSILIIKYTFSYETCITQTI